MVFVKLRETYDLNTVPGKMSVLAIHTPKPEIIIKNYPGLLMQCKAYKPVSCDVRCACASLLPSDVLSVGTEAGDVAPEDMFNPILFKATSNFGMSQIEARINHFVNGETGLVVDGESLAGRNDGINGDTDDFDLYYGLLSDTHQWKHANPQSGFEMKNLVPLVYEMLYSVGDNRLPNPSSGQDNGPAVSANFMYPDANGDGVSSPVRMFKGHSKPMPWLNTTIYNGNTDLKPGFTVDHIVNAENVVPAPQIVVGAVIIPPSRLHKLYYRMVVEWTLEFSSIRSMQEITNWQGLKEFGVTQHTQTYSYSNTAKALGVEKTNLVNDVSMASANVDIKKVM